MLNTEVNLECEPFVHVAVGVIYSTSGQVLIALRKSSQHQGGLWEFPGGKLESGEDCQEALVRELDEELGITAETFEPLIKITHRYTDKTVLLDVWSITQFSGEPTGKEGQPIQWVDINKLSDFQFPEANLPILKAITLPKLVAITGDYTSRNDFLDRVTRAIDRGAGLIQLRLPLDVEFDFILFQDLKRLCQQRQVKLVANSFVERVQYSADIGLHLRSQDLMALTARPVSAEVLLGASCHNGLELQQAQIIGVDYAFLSPVEKTASHADATPLGWPNFSKLVMQANIPVYALGGLGVGDLSLACSNGAQGVALLSGFWVRN